MPTHVLTRSSFSDNTTSETLSFSGSQIGDFLVVYVTKRFGDYFNIPTGWLQLFTGTGSTHDRQVLYRHATAANETVTLTRTSGSWVVFLWSVYRGVHASDPWDGQTTAITGTAATAKTSTGTINTATDDALLVHVAHSAGNNGHPIPQPQAMFVGANQRGQDIVVTKSIRHWHDATVNAPSIDLWTGENQTTRNVDTYILRDDGNGYAGGYVQTDSEFIHTCVNANFEQYSEGASSSPETFYTTATNGSYSETTANSPNYVDSNFYGLLYDNVRIASASSSSTADYGKHLISGFTWSASKNLSGKIISVPMVGNSRHGPYSELGRTFGFTDGTNTRMWHMEASDTQPRSKDVRYPVVIEVDGGFEMEEIGTFNSASFDEVIFGNSYSQNFTTCAFGPICVHAPLKVLGGTTANPVSFLEVAEFCTKSALLTVQNQVTQSGSQFYAAQSMQIGNGSDPVKFKSSLQSLEFVGAINEATGRVANKIGAGSIGLTIYAAAGDSIDLSDTVVNCGNFHTFTEHASTSNTDIYNYNGMVVLTSDVTLQNLANIDRTGATFTQCKAITHNGSSLSGVTVSNVASGETAALQFSAANQTELTAIGTQCGTLTARNNTNAPAIQINYTGTAGVVTIDLSNATFSGNTIDLHFESTNNCDLSITRNSGTLNTTNSVGSTVTVVAPTNALRINPDVTISASPTGSMRYFRPAISEQTPAGSDSGDFLDYEYADTTPIDIDVVEQGYVPVNQQNVTPINGTLNIEMDLDEAYNASHSLTIVTHYTYDRATKAFAILADQNAFDVRSSMADTIRTNSSYYNTPLLLEAKPGGKRIDLIDGATITSMATWKGAGMERYDAADAINPVEKWYAIQSVNNIAGSAVVYRQTNSGDFTVGSLTNNVFDETLQFYSDPDHDGTPATENNSYLLIKALRVGYRQARNDVVAGNGGASLKADLYTIGLNPESHSYAGNPVTDLSLTMTLVAGGTVGGKTFSYKWVDAGTNSGTDIADWINYMGATSPNGIIPGGTGLRWAEMPDMVIYVTGGVETAQGYREGATPTLVGFYMERGGSDHPDLVRAQADDGTYYVPAVTANITVTDLINTASALDRLQIINKTALSAPLWSTGQSVTEGDIYLRSTGYGSELTAGLYLRAGNTGTTHATTEPTWSTTPGGTTVDNDITWTTYAILYEDSDPAGTGYSSSYINGAEFKSGESYEMRFAEMAGTTHFKYWSATGIASSAGFSQSASLLTDAVYATWAGLEGQDGLYFDATYSPNYVASYVVLDADLDFSGKSLGLYYCYLLTTSEGMYRFWDGFTLLDAGNLRNNDDIVDVYLDESAGFVKQTDSVRIFKKTDSSIRPVIDPTTGGAGVEANWRVPVNVVTVATGDAVNQATVQAALTAQGYTTTRAPYIDDIKTKTDQLTFTTPNVVDASASVSEASIRSAIGMASANLDTQLATITADTNELQTNQGNWLTATGFATVNPDNASIAEILTDTGTTIPAIIAALNNLSSADVTAAVPTVTQIKDGVWNATASDYHTNNTTGKVLKGIAEGWIAAEGEVNDLSATDTQFVTTLTESTSSFYSNEILIFTNGALKGQSRIISDYNGTTKAITLDHALTGAPADGVSFIILASHAHLLSEFDALLTANAVPEPTSPPAANAPLAEKIAWTFAMARNRIEQTETQQIVRADDGSTAIGTASTTDDGTTAVRGEFG